MQIPPSKKPTADYSYPWQYFLLVYALSAPFWLLSLFLKHSPLPDNLPLTDIGAALTPTVAAALLRYREGGMVAVRGLFGRVFDYGRIKHSAYFWTAILIFPCFICSLMSRYAKQDKPYLPYPYRLRRLPVRSSCSLSRQLPRNWAMPPTLRKACNGVLPRLLQR